MLALLGLALVKLLAQLATAGRYGFHRDELYYLVTFDELMWAGLYLVARLLARGGPSRLWLAVGVAFEFLGNHNADMAAENPPTRFLSEQLLLIGFVAVPLWIAGLVHLLRRPRFRLLDLAAAVVMLVLLVQRAKSYYAGPVYPLLLAAGAVSFERLVSGRPSPRRRRWLVRSTIGVLVVSTLAAAPLALPVLPGRPDGPLPPGRCP